MSGKRFTVLLFVIALGVLSSGLPATSAAPPEISHRLIIQLKSPSVAEWTYEKGIRFTDGAESFSKMLKGKSSYAAQIQQHISSLKAEKEAFKKAVLASLPNAEISTYVNEFGQERELTYDLLFNGMTIDPGKTDDKTAMSILQQMPEVKDVFKDYAHKPTMYAGLPLVNVAAAWSNPSIGGRDDAGRGIKVASVDGGVHKDAPMFNGAGFDYPSDFPPGGLGLTANNNGKIIASRVYFRSYDPPAPGDENPWPGQKGTSHGVHTTGTMAGNPVEAELLSIRKNISGVAPGAWVMSYRVFYE
ncbi:MAG: S8 family serine peptidase, partial [bacterium]